MSDVLNDIGAASVADYIKQNSEPLLPELARYVTEGPLGPMLQHPLVYDIAVSTLPGLANKRFKLKQQHVAEAQAKGDWHSYVWLHERPYRVMALQDLMRLRLLTWQTVTPLLANVWTDSENIHQCLPFWRQAFARTDGHEWMLDGELAEFNALPERMRVHRGECNDGGVSWTRNKKIATFFANRQINESTGVVTSGTVSKRHVFAYLTRRGEAEVLVTDRSYVR